MTSQTPPAPSRSSPLPWRIAAAATPVAAAFGVALTFLLARVASERVTSDEQIFLGGAGLIARGDGWPYRDFFYTHVPSQALLTATIFRLTRHWLLAARCIDAVSAAGIAATLAELARRTTARLGFLYRFAAIAGVVGVFLFDPLTAYAGGIAWNHDFAALAALLSLATARRSSSPAWTFASGALAGIAATSRLTYGPVAAAMLAIVALAPSEVPRRRRLTVWLAGAIVAAMPAIVVCLHAPTAAWFDNIRYPGLTERFTSELRLNWRLGFAAKLDYVGRIVRRSRAVQLLIAATVAAAVAAGWQRRRSRDAFWCLAAVALALVAIATAFVPTPTYQQYLYAPVPFAAASVALALSAGGPAARRAAAIALAVAAIGCFATARRAYPSLATLRSPKAWAPMQWHATGRALAARVGPGKVLTLMPGLPLEAGLPIYRELSIGRYAARSAEYLTASQRADYHVPDLAAMRGWFDAEPPAAVLMPDPTNSPLEDAIVAVALERGYVAEPFAPRDTRWTLYLPPPPKR